MVLILIYSDTGFNIPSWKVGEMSWVGGWFTDSSYPERGNVSLISLQNVANRLRERQKDGSLFFDGITRLAGPTSLLFSYKYCGSPSRVNSDKAWESGYLRTLFYTIRACSWSVQAKLTRVIGSGNNFSSHKQVFSQTKNSYQAKPTADFYNL